jgi:carbon-monoxide dehydrogenase medium subunit
MRFEYLQPTTIKEAFALLDKYQGEAKVIAGGTDLMLKMRAKVFNPKYVIDISGIAGLDHIDTDGKKGLRIGCLTTIRDLETSQIINQQFPVLAQAASQLGSVAIRNVATIGGNLCHAAPSAECAPALLCLLAKAKIAGPKKERVVPLEEFFTGPGTTVLAKNEILVEIQIPENKPNTKGVYLKHSQRGSIDLATVGVAAMATFEPDKKQCQDVKIALGAVAPTPIRARQAENILRGKNIDDAMIVASAEAAADESCCITDVRASEGYRKEMVKVFTKRAISMLVPK